MTANKPDNKKTMDVSKPGASTPDASARPIVVSDRPMIQDPMMKGADKPEDLPAVEPEKAIEPASHANKIIQPIAEKKDEVEKEEASEEEPKTTTSEPEAKESEKTEEAAVVDAVAGEADVTNKKKEKEQTEAEKAKQEALTKLIDDKKYFVPIGQVTRRRNTRRAFVVVGMLIIIGIVTGYLLIDAGIIKTSVGLPFHIINR